MRVLHHLRVVLVAILAILAGVAIASAQSGPALSGRVVDQAGILDASTRAALTAKLAALEARNSDQLVVATVSSLQGMAIEPYATGLFRAWRLGQTDKDNGALLLVAPNERKVRIEVGYGLEGTLTDAVARLIIEQSIVPRFRAKDYAGGIVQATDDIIQVLTGDAARWQRRAAAAQPQGGLVITRGDGTVVSGWEKTFVLTIAFLMFAIVAGLFGFLFLVVLAAVLVRLGVLPRQKDRQGAWLWLDYVNRDPPPAPAHARHSRRSGRSSSSSWSSSDSSSSSSSDSFSGGGGSSGGGGASGSW